MCDCGKPSATETKTSHDVQGVDASAAEKAHAHAPHAVPDATADAACTCAPSGTGHHDAHAGAATHA